MRGLLLVLMLASTTPLWAQEPTGKTPIVAEKKFMGHKYTYRGQRLKTGFSLSEFKTIMDDHPDALAKINTAQALRVPAMLFAGAGGALIGYPIGQTIGGGDANWTLAAVGAGLAAVGMGFSMLSDNSLKKGVDTYNESIRHSLRTQSFDLKFAFAPSRIDIVLTF